MGLRAILQGAGVACLLLWAVPAAAQVCQYANDGECDEPGIGTAVCEAGTDTADCANLGTPDGFLYGALACSESYCGDAWGLSVDQPTAAGAHKAALEECGADDCALEVTFSRGRCIAVAVSTKHGRHGWATRSTLVDAEASAVENCAQDGSAGCTVVASICSSGG